MNTNLTPSTPRLSELPGNHHPDQCAKCGGCHLLQRWQEHDHKDQPEPRVVVLCKPCADQIIKPHPRLYRGLSPREFVPGSAGVCQDCKWQVHLSCKSPHARFNGGPGLEFSPMPLMALVDGSRYRGPVVFETSPVKECSGKEEHNG